MGLYFSPFCAALLFDEEGLPWGEGLTAQLLAQHSDLSVLVVSSGVYALQIIHMEVGVSCVSGLVLRPCCRLHLQVAAGSFASSRV